MNVYGTTERRAKHSAKTEFPDVERNIIATLVDQSYSARELRAVVYSEEGILFTHLRSLNWTTRRNHVIDGMKLTAQNSVKR